MNALARAGKAFFFITDFLTEKVLVYPLEELADQGWSVQFPTWSNAESTGPIPSALEWSVDPVSFATYHAGFKTVRTGLLRGNSYLANLTYPTRVTTNWSLSDVFQAASAPYKILFTGSESINPFTVFSPESFVKIRDGRIYTYPMKGTALADGPDTAQVLLDDPKELAEHRTIVDLLRNDLNQIASGVRVDKFRYLDRIHSSQGDLWQTSSEISGDLPPGYDLEIGTLLAKLLPAGSITGAPKRKTVEIIRSAEMDERGFYTGVAGVYDRGTLDSAVLIRFLEDTPAGKYYRSGGGITVFSEAEKEYQELIDKVYVPFTGNDLPDRGRPTVAGLSSAAIVG